MAARGRKFEYRLVWRYKGTGRTSQLMAQRQLRILRLLRRLATNEPWRGATIQSLRKSWMRLSLMSDMPWDAVQGLKAKEVILRIQASYPEIEFIRVEWRQVGAWTEMLDPLTNLVTNTTQNSDRRLQAVYDMVEAMGPEELDTWRMTPLSMRDTARTQPWSHAKQTKARKAAAKV